LRLRIGRSFEKKKEAPRRLLTPGGKSPFAQNSVGDFSRKKWGRNFIF